MKQTYIAQIKEAMMKGITFKPEIDLRKDLIMFHGYTMEQVISMRDDEVYNFFDKMEYAEESKDMYPVKCECGHHEMECLGYDDTALVKDCYWLKCPKCNKETHIHECTMDGIFEYVEYEKKLSADIRLLNDCGRWICNSHNYRDREFIDTVTKFHEIHSVDLGHVKHVFYRENASFYKVSFDYDFNDRTEVAEYEANKDCVDKLIQHFFTLQTN